MSFKQFSFFSLLVVGVIMIFSFPTSATHDSTQPTTPLGVTGHGASSTSMQLTWWPSQDNSGIDHYNIYRCQSTSFCTPTLIGTSTTNFFTDTGLSPNTAYFYDVTAVDPEGRESAHSSTSDGYSRNIYTTPSGEETIVITNSPATVAPGQTFSVSWQPTLNPSGSFGHHDAHFNDSLATFGCNPPNCWYETNITNNAGIYSVSTTAPSATRDIYWIPDPHGSGTGFNSSYHHHYPLARIVVTNGNPLAFTTTSLAAASLNTSYTQALNHNSSSEAVGPFSCGISTGRLPANLLLNSSTCVISGTPTETGTFNFTARVKATSENYALRDFTLTVIGADTTPPVISLPAPSSDATVLGPSVTVSATVTDNVGVVGVQFLLDGVNLGAEDTTSPFSIMWDTTQVSNGPHVLTARARDAAGNQTTSTVVSITVNNLKGDLSADGLVNTNDLNLLRSAFKLTGSRQEDLNNDNVVDLRDLGILMSNWRP